MFVVARANTWNSLREVYRKASAHNDINTYIIAMPTYKLNQCNIDDRENIEFLKKNEEGAMIEAYDSRTGNFFDIGKLEPDYIFIENPYDDAYPDSYKIHNLAKKAKVCYVSYGYTMKKSRLQTITIRPSILQCVSYIFSCNNTMYENYAGQMLLSQLVSGKRLYNIGYPRFDIYSNIKNNESSGPESILWLPRWKTEKDGDIKSGKNEGSTFFELKDKLPQYVEKHNEYRLIVRPHPYAFANYIKQGMMTEAEAEEYKQRIESSERMELDTDPAYEKSLIRADILIADFTSMLAEYFVLDRPIIYFGSGDNYPPENIGMYNSFYHVKSWDEAEKVLDGLLAGDDPKKDQRHKAIDDFRKKMPHNVAGRIVDMLVEDYRKGK